MDSDIQKIITALQKLPENYATKNIIVPLLQTLGFHTVEFYGGTSEEGKDILCWEYDKIGDLRLVVAQVKHFKYTNKASDTASLQTVVNQLTTCFKKSLKFTDQSHHLPSEAYLISTYVVDTKSLNTRFSNYPDIGDKKIKIIDGLLLATLLLKHTPNIVKELIGVEIEISSVLKNTLNNEILLKSLGFQSKKDIKILYTDIDFSLGKITTQLFLNGIFQPFAHSISIILATTTIMGNE